MCFRSTTVAVLTILIFVNGNQTSNSILQLELDFNNAGNQDCKECCLFNSTSKQELINLQKLLSTKAQIEFSLKFQKNLLDQLDSGKQLRATNVIIKILSGNTDEGTNCSIDCSQDMELLQCISEVIHEDLTYILSENGQTELVNDSLPYAESICTRNSEFTCGIESMESVLSKEISFASEEERAEKVQELFHISEHLHREIVSDNESSKQYNFIGYWKPNDKKSRRMLDVLTEVKKLEIDTRVYLLNCDYFKAACRSSNVSSVPELRVYHSGKVFAIYDRSYTIKAIINWIRKINAPIFYKLSQDNNVNSFRDGVIPNSPFSNEVQDALTIGFFDTTKSVIYKDYINVAERLHGKYHFGVFQHPDVAKWARHPIIFTFKPKEFGHMEMWHQELRNDTIEEFVIHSSIPTVIPLNEENLPDIFEHKKQCYALVEDAGSAGNSALKKKFYQYATNIATTQNLPVQFAYTALQTNDVSAIKFLKTLRIRRKLLPALVIIDLSKVRKAKY
uniref:Thioredoxin domain-containing protein n=1 Tax=Syphacia muris TaxID=451379 RepID=A0A0N5ATS9_9BILA